MSRAAQARPVPVSLPFRGMSTRFPLAKMPQEFSPWVKGYQLGAGFLESPKGVKYMFAGEAGIVGGFGQDPTDSEEIVQFSQDGTLTGRPYNVFTNTSGTAATGGTGAGERVFTMNFAGYLIAFQDGAAPNTWNGSALAAMTFTGPTLANVIGGTTHNEQFYCFEKDSTSVWFRDSVGALTGAMTEYEIDLISRYQGKVMSVFTFTLSSGEDATNLWAVALDSGEVIVATGIDPSDATWTIKARILVGRPLGYNNFIEKDGDVLLLTTRGLVSMRQVLLTQDSSVSIPMISDEIEKYWVQLVKDIEGYESAGSYAPETALSSYIRGVWHQLENRLYIFCPRTLSPYTSATGDFGYQLEGGSMILIYDFNYRGWTVRTFNDADLIPGGDDYQIVASYYEPRTGSVFFSTNEPTIAAVWKIAGNTRYSDNYATPTTSNTGAGTSTTFDSIEFNSNPDSWTNESNAASSDGTYATYSAAGFGGVGYTPWLLAEDFGFSVPTAATILGLEVSVEWKSAGGKQGTIYAAYTTDSGDTVQGERAVTTYTSSGFPTSDTVTTFGGVALGYGNMLTPAQVNDAGFGVMFAASSASEEDYSVDQITATIYYTEAIASADMDIPMEIISAPFSTTESKMHVKGWQVMQSGDSGAKQSLVMQTQGNISEKVSGSTANATIGAGVSRDVYNVGIAADLVQFILSTTTSSSDDRAHKLLGIAPILEQGGIVG